MIYLHVILQLSILWNAPPVVQKCRQACEKAILKGLPVALTVLVTHPMFEQKDTAGGGAMGCFLPAPRAAGAACQIW